MLNVSDARTHCVKCGQRISEVAAADQIGRGRLCDECLNAAYARMLRAILAAPDESDDTPELNN